MRENITNATSLDGFNQYVMELKQNIKRQYDRCINKDLARQNWQDLFKRNVTSVLKQAYEDSLIRLQQFSFELEGVETEKGFSKLTVQALNPFDGFVEEFMQYTLQKHRTSCALSNFPDEHKPSDDYINEVKRQIAEYWRDFALGANAYFLECR